jgi:hypothetical protein
MIQIDDWKEIVAAGVMILLALALVFAFLRWFLGRGGRVRGKGAEIGLGAEAQAPCAPYVAEHATALARIEKKLEEMDDERQTAREVAIETTRATQKMIRGIMVSQDAVIDALQSAKIGNGNLTKARDALAQCGDVREGFLIDSLAACRG